MQEQEETRRREGDDPIEELLLFWSQIQTTLRRFSSGRGDMPGRQAQLVKFLDSNMTWGSVGLILGAIDSPWAKILLPTAWLVMLASIWRVNFFQGPDKKVEVGGNFILAIFLTFAFLGLWRIVPKPKEPPTLKEIADEVSKKITFPPTA
jgi:hypothetical protein